MANDAWNKFDLGKIVIPFLVAVVAVILNAQVSKRAITGTKLEVAVGVLSQEPSEGTNALRKWAIEVLQDPTAANHLGEAAAAELRKQALPSKSN